MRGLVGAALLSTLGRPLTFGSAVKPAELCCGSWMLVRFKKENRFLSFFEGFGDRRSIGLGDFVVIKAGVVTAAPGTSPESHVADVSGLSPPEEGARDASSGAKVISKPIRRSVWIKSAHQWCAYAAEGLHE